MVILSLTVARELFMLSLCTDRFSNNGGNNLTVTDDDLVHSNVFVDTHEPLVLSLDLSSNYQNPSYAISGNKLTLTFKTNERIYDATATILNRPANITITNDTVLATIFVESHDEGFVPFELTVSDLVYAINLTESNLTSNGVIVDHQTPQKINLTINSDHSKPQYAKSGAAITIQLVTNEMLFSATATVNNNSVNTMSFWTMLHGLQLNRFDRDINIYVRLDKI